VSSLILEQGPARVELEAALGARLASLVVAGHELLVGPEPDPMTWGCYPMAPWAGRVRHGRFCLDGEEHQLPVTLGPHAIHGTAYVVPWRCEPEPLGEDGPGGGARVTLAVELGPDRSWPFPARLEQRVWLTPDRLRLDLRLISLARERGQRMPAMVGWHPWFQRRLGRAEVTLDIEAATMYERDESSIPTGRLVAPPPPPWDDCFTGLRRGPDLRWPDVLELQLRSSCDHWVIYTHPERAICVEPQTAAPDAFNRRPLLLGPGESLDAWFELTWRIL
jgi:aldose 1-epimerase